MSQLSAAQTTNKDTGSILSNISSNVGTKRSVLDDTVNVFIFLFVC